MSLTKESKINNYLLNHSLNDIMIKKFIDASDLSVQPIVRKIIKNTFHVSFEDFLMSFKRTIKLLENYIKMSKMSMKDKKTRNRGIYVFVDKLNKNYMEKSNYWLYKLFKSLCVNFEINTISSFTDESLKPNDFVLLIDDCIYSGHQMSNTITFNSMVFTENKLKLNICVLVPFITEIGKLTIERAMRLNTTLDQCSFKLFYSKIISESTNDILTEDEIKIINEYYNKYENFMSKYLIYFDHKLADEVSTIPLFYSGLVPNNHNRTLLLKTSFGAKDVDKLLYIPIINNCEKIRNFNTLVPECPYPIYKERGYNKLVNTIIQNRSNTKALSATIYKKKRTTTINKNKTY